MLRVGPEFLQVRMLRVLERVRVWPTESWTEKSEELNLGDDLGLSVLIQLREPGIEFIRCRDILHDCNIALRL
jgi:hypothetical protein